MTEDFFVMLECPDGSYTPMIDETFDEVAFYATVEEARRDAEVNPFGLQFGYEIFKLGEGVYHD